MLIVAHGRNGEIGKGKDMPWGRSFPSDLKWFNRVTTSFGAAVLVVGKTTYDTLPQKVINDPTRTFAILTSKVREVTPTGNNYYVPNVTELCNYFGERDFIIIGGGKVYDLFYPRADMVFTTLIHNTWPDKTTSVTMAGGLRRYIVKRKDIANLDNSGLAVTIVLEFHVELADSTGYYEHITGALLDDYWDNLKQ